MMQELEPRIKGLKLRKLGLWTEQVKYGVKSLRTSKIMTLQHFFDRLILALIVL